MMPWLLVGLAVVVLVLAALAATGRGGQMPEPPVEDEWIDPDSAAAGMVDFAPEADPDRAATDDPIAGTAGTRTDRPLPECPDALPTTDCARPLRHPGTTRPTFLCRIRDNGRGL